MSEFNDIINQMPILFEKLESLEPIDRKDARKLPKEGVYVFYEGSKPIYVGRSRNIANRVLTHSRQSSGHNSASFAFLLAKEKARETNINISVRRKELESEPAFTEIYSQEKVRIGRMKIRAVEIEDPETQAIFEIYASKMLRTKYNDFATH